VVISLRKQNERHKAEGSSLYLTEYEDVGGITYLQIFFSEYHPFVFVVRNLEKEASSRSGRLLSN